MKILVKTLTGKMLTFDVQPSDSIDNLKQLVGNSEGIEPNQHSFVFAGSKLESGRSFADYNLQNESTLHMVQICRYQ